MPFLLINLIDNCYVKKLIDSTFRVLSFGSALEWSLLKNSNHAIKIRTKKECFRAKKIETKLNGKLKAKVCTFLHTRTLLRNKIYTHTYI